MWVTFFYSYKGKFFLKYFFISGKKPNFAVMFLSLSFMKKYILTLNALLLSTGIAMAQKINFEEYDLPNGLHVILHQDNSAPVVTTTVMYHVGAKDDLPGKSGFAHFFEHLLFEGTKNIPRSRWFDIVSAHGGDNNAFTDVDKTYYYETVPSNNLQLALWMESERLLHPVINQIGVDTQKEVVKEEKREGTDNVPYGKIIYMPVVQNHLFDKHPYKHPTIGSMDDLNSAKLEDFIRYNHRYYNPNNAVLVVAGDFQKDQAKSWIETYFGPIKNRQAKPVRNYPMDAPITQTKKVTDYDANITAPAKVLAWRTPKMTEQDARVMDFIQALLANGERARLYKKMVEEKKEVLQFISYTCNYEDIGILMIAAVAQDAPLEQLTRDMDSEIKRLQTELISEKEYEKLLNSFETSFIANNSDVRGIAYSLAVDYTFYKDTNLINKELDLYRKVTREDIRRVAKQYLNANQRLEIDYLPEKKSN